MNNCIQVGQCINSRNGFFFVYLQSNADFVLYWGELDSGTARWHAAYSQPGFPLQPTGEFYVCLQEGGVLCENDWEGNFIWSTTGQLPPLNGDGHQYALVMQDDGNLCLYRDPGTPNSQLVWSPGDEVYDPVVSYDIIDPGLWGPNNVVASDPNPTVIYTQEVPNTWDNPQTLTVVFSYTIPELPPTWSDPSGLYPPFEVSFKEGSSTDVTVELSATQLVPLSVPPPPPVMTWSMSVTVTVPPNSSVEIQVSATLFTITIPYNVNGKLNSQQGNWVYKVLKGTYTETKHGDFNVTVTPPAPYSAHAG
jgi:hypothetical protein